MAIVVSEQKTPRPEFLAYFDTPIDVYTCEVCEWRKGAQVPRGFPIPHPNCTNPNGCRCKAVVPMPAEAFG